ncbi:MAG: insulinase family protein [Saprospiraceae bacterium]|nr:insulinase family protein [Saprospiraceae bacterium]
MKKLIFAFSVIFFFTQCAKKTIETASNVQQNQVDKSWRKMAPAPAAARDIQLGAYSTFDLANGLKVIVVENHKLPKVSYQLSLNNEALIEGDKAGYTSFAGELINKGTKNRTKAQIDESIDFIGADLSTSASGIFASSLKKHGDKLLEIMTDVLYNPTFPKEEFEKVRKRTASNLASSKTNPEAIASNIRSIVNFGSNHPYGEVQTDETIKNITVDDCVKYYNTYFKPNNAYLVIVGDITPEEAKAQANKYFSTWEKGTIPSFNYNTPTPVKGAQVRFGNKDGAVQSVINISYPVDMKPGSGDAIKASLMNSILGGGIFSGRLMQNLREKKAYTYGARSNISTDKLLGNFNAFASVRNEVTDSSVTEFLYEMNRIVKEPVSESDLKLAKSSTAGNFGRSLESPQTIANFALNTFRYNLPKDYYNNYLKNVDAVTVADIQAMASKYIRPENCNIVVVGNKDNVADKLKKFDADGELDFYDAFGKKIETNNVALSADITAQSVIEDYIEALGGSAKLKAVKTLQLGMKASMMGQEASFETYQMAPDKYASKMQMMGMVVQEQKYNGVKASVGQMGKNQILTEGSELAEIKKQAILFEQLRYNTTGYKMELKGIENVEGSNCYKLVVTDPMEKQTTEFYDVKSGLLMRTVSASEKMTMTIDYKDYKAVDGIMIPHTSSISGVMPTALVMEATNVAINKEISPDTFKVE